MKVGTVYWGDECRGIKRNWIVKKITKKSRILIFEKIPHFFFRSQKTKKREKSNSTFEEINFGFVQRN